MVVTAATMQQLQHPYRVLLQPLHRCMCSGCNESCNVAIVAVVAIVARSNSNAATTGATLHVVAIVASRDGPSPSSTTMEPSPSPKLLEPSRQSETDRPKFWGPSPHPPSGGSCARGPLLDAGGLFRGFFFPEDRRSRRLGDDPTAGYRMTRLAGRARQDAPTRARHTPKGRCLMARDLIRNRATFFTLPDLAQIFGRRCWHCSGPSARRSLRRHAKKAGMFATPRLISPTGENPPLGVGASSSRAHSASALRPWHARRASTPVFRGARRTSTPRARDDSRKRF